MSWSQTTEKAFSYPSANNPFQLCLQIHSNLRNAPVFPPAAIQRVQGGTARRRHRQRRRLDGRDEAGQEGLLHQVQQERRPVRGVRLRRRRARKMQLCTRCASRSWLTRVSAQQEVPERQRLHRLQSSRSVWKRRDARIADVI